MCVFRVVYLSRGEINTLLIDHKKNRTAVCVYVCIVCFSGDVRFSGPRVGGPVSDRARLLLGAGEDQRGQARTPRAPENVQVRERKTGRVN